MVIRFRNISVSNVIEGNNLIIDIKLMTWMLTGRRIRMDFSDGDSDWEEQFYILRKSWCPAVLTENFFMDSRSDLEYLQNRAGEQAVVDTHVEGIMEWLSI